LGGGGGGGGFFGGGEENRGCGSHSRVSLAGLKTVREKEEKGEKKRTFSNHPHYRQEEGEKGLQGEGSVVEGKFSMSRQVSEREEKDHCFFWFHVRGEGEEDRSNREKKLTTLLLERKIQERKERVISIIRSRWSAGAPRDLFHLHPTWVGKETLGERGTGKLLARLSRGCRKESKSVVPFL